MRVEETQAYDNSNDDNWKNKKINKSNELSGDPRENDGNYVHQSEKYGNAVHK